MTQLIKRSRCQVSSNTSASALLKFCFARHDMVAIFEMSPPMEELLSNFMYSSHRATLFAWIKIAFSNIWRTKWTSNGRRDCAACRRAAQGSPRAHRDHAATTGEQHRSRLLLPNGHRSDRGQAQSPREAAWSSAELRNGKKEQKRWWNWFTMAMVKKSWSDTTGL